MRTLQLLLLAAAALPVAAQPRRIVSTAPSLTEMLFALGLGDRVVGVTTYCRYPPEAARRPRIGTFLEPDLEAVLAQRPDLVLVQQNPVRLRERLEAFQLKVLELDHESIGGILASLRQLGEIAGRTEAARALVTSIRSELEQVRRRTSRSPRRRVLFLVGRVPGALEGMVAAGRASYLNELIGIAGGENIFAAAPSAYPKVSIEEVLARDPEVIVDLADMASAAGVSEPHRRAAAAEWNRYPNITAVRSRRVYALASDVFVVPGPRVVQAARQLGSMIHPEAGP